MSLRSRGDLSAMAAQARAAPAAAAAGRDSASATTLDVPGRYRHWWRTTGTGGAVCKGATPSVEQQGGRGFKPWLRSLLD